MQDNNNIIIHLNCLLSDELIAMNQYFLHSKIFSNWGLERLYNLEYKECMDELNHADWYIKRILFLEGVPVLKNFNELNIKNTVEDILQSDLKLEHHNICNLKVSIVYADSIKDYVSKEIMINILKDEEEHIHFLKNELDLIKKIGIHNYIQSQLMS